MPPSNIGRIFGLTLDSDGNIYVAPTTVYGANPSPSTIKKIDRVTGDEVPPILPTWHASFARRDEPHLVLVVRQHPHGKAAVRPGGDDLGIEQLGREPTGSPTIRGVQFDATSGQRRAVGGIDAAPANDDADRPELTLRRLGATCLGADARRLLRVQHGARQRQQQRDDADHSHDDFRGSRTAAR